MQEALPTLSWGPHGAPTSCLSHVGCPPSQLLTLVSEPSILPVGGRASCTGFVEGLRPLSSKALAVSVVFLEVLLPEALAHVLLCLTCADVHCTFLWTL